jgi:hypothetical protein
MCVHICEPSLIKHPKGILPATEEKRFGEGTSPQRPLANV